MTTTAAFFDVDGTLVGKNIVHQFLFIRRHMLPWPVRELWTSLFLAKTPYYYWLDKRSRTQLNRVFYKNYAGLDSRKVRSLVEACFQQVIFPHIYDEVSSCIAQHRSRDRRIVLVTGSIDFIIQPLARFLKVDDLVAPTLVENNGFFTGDLNGPPIGEVEKARRIKLYAREKNLDLTESYAYGDSIADLPMLQEVGHPHVVNPDASLAQTARKRDWPRLQWKIRESY